jgi:Domain of unknown function (DUF4331)
MTQILRNHVLRTTAAIALTALAACSDSPMDKPGPDAGGGSGSGEQPTAMYHQIEQLARPGINEALLITEAFNAGFNATAPTFTGVPTDTLNAVVGEAKTVLQALYLGACFINGQIPGITADSGVHPAGFKCHAIGGAIVMGDGVTLTADSKTAAKAYADKVFDQFILDVMRVDTGVVSNYLTPCVPGSIDSKPLLCGGRFVSDDVIDVTYDYLLNGAANYLTPGDGGAVDKQVLALVSDGVAFSKDPAKNVDSLSKPDVTNTSQFHPDVTQTFPYSAAPF